MLFFNDTATTEIYTLSLHDALPIYRHALQHREEPPRAAARVHQLWEHPGPVVLDGVVHVRAARPVELDVLVRRGVRPRSEEHTSELQSRQYLVCRLLLEKKTSADER